MALRAFRGRIFAIAVIAGVLLSGAAAPAAVDMATGIRYVIPNGTVDQCGTKAAAALNAYLQNAAEAAPGSGEWIATGPIGAAGTRSTTASGTVHCYPSGKGYVVTFTCAVQTPDNPYDAQALCLDIAHNFSGKPQTPLPTPSPQPTGCTTANLVGTWQSDNDPKLSFKMDENGDLTGSDGVSGNWILTGSDATITYYGNHSMTLSPDGKHLKGGGYSLTRKC
jgi:hypothetical protein